jgi:hypothetical protein
MSRSSFDEIWNSIGFKDPEDSNKVQDMNFLIAMIMFEMAAWCNVREIPFTVVDTISTKEEDTLLDRISSSHRDKRAFDLRSHSFTKTQQQEFIQHFNKKYKEDASISYSDFKPRLVVLHGEGSKEHFHVAINSRYAIKEIATNYVEK